MNEELNLTDTFDVDALGLLPETETDGLRHTFCCPHINVTLPTTA